MNWRNVGAGAGSSRGDPESVAICHQQAASGALPSCRSHFYDHPNLDLIPGLDYSSDGRAAAAANASTFKTNEWFDYIKSMKLKTYFNDHPVSGALIAVLSVACSDCELPLCHACHC
jgi:hypothetical protein|eukprot:SAG25_NODE_86_length_16515_cov_5.529996_10_plen_117_part_00